MNEQQQIKLAKESAILAMIHKYKLNRVDILENIERSSLTKAEFDSLYEKYFQLINDIDNE